MSLIIDENGIKIPDTQTVLEAVQNVFKNALGDDYVVDMNSSDGAIINEIVLMIVNNNQQMLSLFNQYSVRTAQGIFLDYLADLFGLTRRQATYTEVKVDFTGLTNLIIPKGFRIQNEDGNLFLLNSDVILEEGKGKGLFTSEVAGAINFPANTAKIYDTIAGLDSISNPLSGVLGLEPETDDSLRIRIVQSRSRNSVGTYESVINAISQITDKYSLTVNDTLSNIIVGDVTIPPHCLLLCVGSGADQDIAKVLYEKKSAGCGMIGDTTVEYATPFGGTFSAVYQKAKNVTISFTVNINNDKEQIGDVVNIVKQTIYNTFNNINNIGNSFYSSEFIAALDDAGVIKIESLLLSLDGGASQNVINLNNIQLASTSLDLITVNLLGRRK